ncbi:MAG: anion permease, partial [Bacteroidetes bacterium]|nr:anion permease [Bacteroidota bacterium]
MKVQLLKIATGIITSIILYFIMQEIQDNHLISSMVAIVLLMAIWWITEAVPLAVTSLLPVFLYPATNIMSTTDIAPSYMNQVIFLFIGGFIIAFAMERWNLHKRIALRIILLIGTDVNRILLGMMVSSYLLSMWISNTATTMMMLPTAFAVIARVAGLVASKEIGKQFGKGVLLGIAYSASIGGTATLIGTPPNLIFQAQYISTFGAENAIPFATWFQFGLPTSLILLAAAYIILKKMFCSGIKTTVD